MMLCVSGILSGVWAGMLSVISIARCCSKLSAQQLGVSSMGLGSGPP